MLLVDRLRETEKPFFGHQRAIGLDGSYPLEKIIGRKPAFVGFPINDILRDRVKKEEARKKYKEQILAAYRLGQIIEFDWHAIHPKYAGTKTYTVEGGKTKSYCGYKHDPFNPDKTIESALKSDKFYQQLDEIASFFLELESEGVEYLFRPFHEMNLKVFWWGSNNSSEDYRKLYKTTVEYLRNKGLHPIMVFAPNYRSGLKSYYADYYPGDEYVDILGLDWYYPDQAEGVEIAKFLNEFAKEHGKILAFTECGPKLGGFQKLSFEQKESYFPSLLNFLNSAEFKYIRFWTAIPYVPTKEPELTFFKEQFLPHVRLLDF